MVGVGVRFRVAGCGLWLQLCELQRTSVVVVLRNAHQVLTMV